MAKLFAADDFSKEIVVGDELVFDKDIKRLRVDLTWEGTDLDVCAFLLGKDGVMTEKSDLVYYKSERRWLPNKAFDDPAFDPLDGKVSVWPAQGFKNPIKWRDATLPISGDDAVIGSWDDMSDSEECGETMHVLLDEVAHIFLHAHYESLTSILVFLLESTLAFALFARIDNFDVFSPFYDLCVDMLDIIVL